MITKDKIDELKKKYNIEEEIITKAIYISLVSIAINHNKWSIKYDYSSMYGIKNLYIAHPFECENLSNILLFLKEVSELL